MKVVPNPYKVDDPQRNYLGTNKIRFTSLPQRAMIEIFDITGERIWQGFNRDSGQAEVVWEQETFGNASGVAVNPGIYFWKVTSLMPESMGKVQTGTFVVIK